jgi:hypothetical protein
MYEALHLLRGIGGALLVLMRLEASAAKTRALPRFMLAAPLLGITMDGAADDGSQEHVRPGGAAACVQNLHALAAWPPTD